MIINFDTANGTMVSQRIGRNMLSAILLEKWQKFNRILRLFRFRFD